MKIFTMYMQIYRRNTPEIHRVSSSTEDLVHNVYVELKRGQDFESSRPYRVQESCSYQIWNALQIPKNISNWNFYNCHREKKKRNV